MRHPNLQKQKGNKIANSTSPVITGQRYGESISSRRVAPAILGKHATADVPPVVSLAPSSMDLPVLHLLKSTTEQVLLSLSKVDHQLSSAAASNLDIDVSRRAYRNLVEQLGSVLTSIQPHFAPPPPIPESEKGHIFPAASVHYEVLSMSKGDARCAGFAITKGRRCKLPASVGYYCHISSHQDQRAIGLSQDGLVFESDNGLDDRFPVFEFAEWIPSYLTLTSQLKIRKEMQKLVDELPREPGYIYAMQFGNDTWPHAKDVVSIKVGKTGRQNGKRLQEHRKHWSSVELKTLWADGGGEGSSTIGSLWTPFYYRLESLIKLELSDLSASSVYLASDWCSEIWPGKPVSVSDRSSPDNSNGWSKNSATPGSSASEVFSSSNICTRSNGSVSYISTRKDSDAWLATLQSCPDPECDTHHKEIYHFKSFTDDERRAKVWEKVVKPVIQRWEDFIQKWTEEGSEDVTDEQFPIEKIIDARRQGRGEEPEYLVRWVGFPLNDDDWLPRSELEECEALDKWEEENGKVVPYYR